MNDPSNLLLEYIDSHGTDNIPAKLLSVILKITEHSGCKGKDPSCPCQDGDACHYEGVDPMNIPDSREWWKAIAQALSVQLFDAEKANKEFQQELQSAVGCYSLSEGRNDCVVEALESAEAKLQAQERELAGLLSAAKAAQVLIDTMEECHVCKGSLVLEESPVHCEDCSADCENHDEPECATIQSLHIAAKRKLRAAIAEAEKP